MCHIIIKAKVVSGCLTEWLSDEHVVYVWMVTSLCLVRTKQMHELIMFQIIIVCGMTGLVIPVLMTLSLTIFIHGSARR